MRVAIAVLMGSVLLGTAGMLALQRHRQLVTAGLRAQQQIAKLQAALAHAQVCWSHGCLGLWLMQPYWWYVCEVA